MFPLMFSMYVLRTMCCVLSVVVLFVCMWIYCVYLCDFCIISSLFGKCPIYNQFIISIVYFYHDTSIEIGNVCINFRLFILFNCFLHDNDCTFICLWVNDFIWVPRNKFFKDFLICLRICFRILRAFRRASSCVLHA